LPFLSEAFGLDALEHREFVDAAMWERAPEVAEHFASQAEAQRLDADVRLKLGHAPTTDEALLYTLVRLHRDDHPTLARALLRLVLSAFGDGVGGDASAERRGGRLLDALARGRGTDRLLEVCDAAGTLAEHTAWRADLERAARSLPEAEG
jgi:hypothetical protein